MGFMEDLDKYIDSDYLIGSHPNPATTGTNGNPLHTLGVAGIIMNIKKERNQNVINKLKEGAVRLRQISGIYNHKARSFDQVTHDDLIGLTCFALTMELPIHKSIVDFGIRNHWVMTNTGKWYWDACLWFKPWQVAYYKHSVGYKVNIFERFFYGMSLFLGSFFKSGMSNEIINLMMSITDNDRLSKFEQYAVKRMLRKIEKKWNGIGNLFAAYYGSNHPFAVYGNSIFLTERK